jgi:hypothetical protein
MARAAHAETYGPIMPRYKSVSDQLQAQSIPEPNSGCFLWVGTVSQFGYGTATANGRTGQKVHRLAYEAAHGPIPNGMHVLHRCDVRCCVNPDHLFLGTNADNVADKMAKGRYRGAKPKLTPEQALALRSFNGTSRAAAKHFGISKSQAHLIMSGASWRHLPSG